MLRIRSTNAWLALLAAASVAASPGRTSARTQPPRPTPRATMEALLKALSSEDRRSFDALTTPDFRAFDGGRTLDRSGFFGVVLEAHRAGQQIRWSVTDERVTIGGDVAVMNYVNDGAIGPAGSMQPMTWLEVATFRATPDGWKVTFVESQRAK